MSNYPPITLGAVNALEEILTNYQKQGKKYLEEAPYSLDIKAQLSLLLSILRELNPKNPKNPKNQEPIGDVDVTKEMDELYTSLKNFKGTEELAPTERIAVLRIQTNLLEKVIEMRERALGVADYVIFRETVMEFISNKFEPDDINELKNRLTVLTTLTK